MRLHAIVLYAAVYPGRGPRLIVHAFRQEQRVADYPSVIGPSGPVIGVSEVVIDAYRRYSRWSDGIVYRAREVDTENNF